MEQRDEVRYFQSDSGALVACVGPWGGVAMFRLRAGDRKWEFLVPESPAWDAVHQGIFRNMHDYDPVDPGRLPPDLPTLPDIPRGPFPEPEDHVLPEEPVHASHYPAVTAFLNARERGAATAFVVLLEDGYETSFGDGEFHYFENAFFDEDDAQRYLRRCPGTWDEAQREWYRFHLRSMTIVLDRDKLTFPDFRLERYDRHTPVEVLQSLELRLSGRSSESHLPPRSSWWRRLKVRLHGPERS